MRGKVETVLREYVEKYITGLRSDTLSFEDWIQVAKIYYDHLGWITVPVRIELEKENGKIRKKPILKWGQLRDISWEELERAWRRTPNIAQTMTVGIALVCGRPTGITVIDIDDIAKFEAHTGLKLDDLVGKTYAQRSVRGGVHLFYRYVPELQTGVFSDAGYDVRNDGGIIVLYPSYFPKEKEGGETEILRYVPISYHDVAEMPAELLRVLRKEEKEKGKKEEKTGRRVLISKGEKRVDEILEIAPLIGELYREGKVEGWWDIDCSFVGGLVQMGFTDEEIHSVLEKVYGEEYDEKETQYVIDRAREKEGQIRGLGSFVLKLKEFAEEGEERATEILKVLLPRPEFLGHRFARIGNTLLKEWNDGELRPVGPYLELESVLSGEEDGETYYLLRYGEKTFPMKLGDDRTLQSSIEGHTGVPVVERKAMKEYLLRLVSLSPPRKVYRKRTGWCGEEFKYPLNASEDEIWDLPGIEKFRVGGEKEKHREIVKKVLCSGSDLSILVVASLSAPLLYPLGLNPYLVHISGPHGTGKTTASIFATSIWYYGREYLTLFGTRNALELTLSRYTDIPVLLDEEELTKDSELVQNLAYMLFSGKGKGRANIRLDVQQREIRSVVFTTSEHSLEDTLINAGRNPVQKLGALRRTLHVRIFDREEFWKGVDFKEVEQSTKEVYGHFGLEWIEFISDRERIQRAYSKATKEKLVDGSEHIFLSIWSAYHLLCEFFGVEEIEELRKVIEKYVEGQEKILREDWDLLQRFTEEFSSWVAGEKDHFYSEEVGEPKSPVYGKIEGGKVYVLTSYFREFCSEKGFSEKVILEELERKGILLVGSGGKRTMKKISGHTVPTYAIDLEKLPSPASPEQEEREDLSSKPDKSEQDEVDMEMVEDLISRFSEKGEIRIAGVSPKMIEELRVRLMEHYDIEIFSENGFKVFKRKEEKVEEEELPF